MNRSSNHGRPRSLAAAAGRLQGAPPSGKRNFLLPFFALTLAGMVGGCSQGSIEDLRAYAQSVHNRPGGEIEPLPPIKPYNVYTYESGDSKDPFQSFYQEEPETADVPAEDPGGPKPDFDRNKEELESFPLDSLRMVGTMENEADQWAIVLAADSTIHRVQIGNYLGQNHGKIVNIQEDRIDLIEIARDSGGRWQERPASVALVEEE